jgi:hypothetical protein
MSKAVISKLPVLHIGKPTMLNKPVVLVSEEEYKQLLEDIEDLRDALKAEEEFSKEGGVLFTEYDKARRRKKR